jgi:hypothetical protein
MPRKSKKQQPQPEPAKSFDEFAEDTEGMDDEAANVDPADLAAPAKLRDWRDVEKLKEERLLRRLVDDDLDLLD